MREIGDDELGTRTLGEKLGEHPEVARSLCDLGFLALERSSCPWDFRKGGVADQDFKAKYAGRQRLGRFRWNPF